jgi:hypothetical protein
VSATDLLRRALDDVVTKITWRPDKTALVHDSEALNTLIGCIVMVTSEQAHGEPQAEPGRELREALEAAERVKASAIQNSGRLTPSAILDIQTTINALRAAFRGGSGGSEQPIGDLCPHCGYLREEHEGEDEACPEPWRSAARQQAPEVER